MKNPLFLIGAFLLTVAFSTKSNAQGTVPCVETINQFFHEEVVKAVSEGSAPVILNRLGTNPQFGRIRRHTSASAYAHLKAVKRRSKRNGAELDRLLRTLGYSGSEDPEFDKDDITPVIVPAGSVGWMGSGSKKYIKAQFGKDFEGYKIFVKEGPCFVYIMKTCGNIFYQDIPSCDQDIPCPECNNFSSWSANNTANPFCNCTPCPDCQDTVDQTINLSGAGEITSGDRVMETKEVELVASYGGQSLCLGKLTVPVSVSYEYTASGSTSASEVVRVDNQNGNALSAVNLKIPVNLDFDVEEGQTSFGDDGAIRMDVTKKRFAVLKKSYAMCATDMTSEGMEGLSATEIESTETVVTDAASDGVVGKKKQTIFFAGSDAISEVVSKEHNPTVTVIAHAKKTGKLGNGESADKYLCLGQYGVAGASALQYMLTGTSNLTHALEVCDGEGAEPAEKNIDLPIELDASFTKQEMKVGDDGKVYIEITEQQYKKMGKRFSKCCSNGDESCF
ncbi:DNA gyrase inhibitor YacG [Arcticibacterium luteifluviistationis]|uniref:Uncharacterized protein n=1 Tax=Arcticibacterium luteifluviistationis TaxID=1784714 RepID=A0A2Z4GD40_9BACT|nr:hypothetical protein [Arcticibacterium luteifluviistationis]AWV99232.1 hypothetical protein DJ013_14085 [Arcticibacterium luteifluviistationis]